MAKTNGGFRKQSANAALTESREEMLRELRAIEPGSCDNLNAVLFPIFERRLERCRENLRRASQAYMDACASGESPR